MGPLLHGGEVGGPQDLCSSGPDPVILKSLTMHDSVTKILNGISLDLTFWGQLRFLKAGITQIKGIPAGFVKTFLMLE